MAAFKNYPSVDSVRKDLMTYAKATLADLLKVNEKKWNELFKTPAKDARREFNGFHNECERLPYGERIFQLSCFKIDSLFLSLPSFRGKARNNLNHKILSAIQAAWKKDKARIGSKQSKAMIFEVSKDQLKRFIDGDEGLNHRDYTDCFNAQWKFTIFITVATLLSLFMAIYLITDNLPFKSFKFVPFGASLVIFISCAIVIFLYI